VTARGPGQPEDPRPRRRQQAGRTGPFRVRSLEDLAPGGPVEIARVAGRAFSDYPVPLRLGPPDVEALVRRDDIDLGASVALEHGGAMVGLALLARRAAKGRIAMMGIEPSLRGRGGGRLLGERAVEVLRARGVTRIVLEVLDGNEAAAALYRGLGFRSTRRLVGRARQHAPPPPECERGPGRELAAVDLAACARALAAHGDDGLPWQLERVASSDVGQRAFTLGGVAWAWLQLPSARSATLRGLLVDRRMRRRGVAHGLLAALDGLLPGRRWDVPPLVPAGGAADLALSSARFAPTVTQSEMELVVR
jgi:ribosomal protein S18 acetylase RimI-like enzyme